MFSEADSQARNRMLLTAAFIALVAFVLPHFMSMRVDYSLYQGPILFGVSLGVSLPFIAWRKLSSPYAAIECCIVSVFSGTSILTLTYCAMRSNFPLADDLLASWDRRLGFSTPDFISAVYSYPLLGRVLAFSYGTLIFQTLAMPFVLCSGGHVRRCYQYGAAFVVCDVIATICCIPFPSYGAMVGQGVDPSPYPCSALYRTYDFIAALEHVRHDAYFVLNGATANGIVTFPSIHAGSAAVFMWAVWPMRRARYPIVALNLLMTVSALACGAHYLVDVIVGDALAVVAVKLVTLDTSLLRHRLSRLRVPTLAAAPSL